MSRIIYCHFLKKDSEGLDFQLYPGEIGQRIYHEISKEAWSLWMNKQTMLINEHKLNMMDVQHRQLLEEEMLKFLFEGKDVHIEGYVPQNK